MTFHYQFVQIVINNKTYTSGGKNFSKPKSFNYNLTTTDETGKILSLDALGELNYEQKYYKNEKQIQNKLKSLDKSFVLSGIYNKDINLKKITKPYSKNKKCS